MLYGALEAGGTKMVCAVGKEDGTILEQVSIPTTTPEETLPKIIEYFKDKDIAALGVAAFGPVDVNPSSGTYGYILDTPKLPWRNYNLLGALRDGLHLPMGLDTDVNGSCLGEMTFGCAKGLDNVLYLTCLLYTSTEDQRVYIWAAGEQKTVKESCDSLQFLIRQR